MVWIRGQMRDWIQQNALTRSHVGIHPKVLNRTLGSVKTAIRNYRRLCLNPRLHSEGHMCGSKFRFLTIFPEKVRSGCQWTVTNSSTPISGFVIPSIGDCRLWDAVEKIINRSAFNTQVELVAKVKELFEDRPKNSLWKACSDSRNALKLMLEADGGYFK